MMTTAPDDEPRISYRHHVDQPDQPRFIALAGDTLPAWATDIKPYPDGWSHDKPMISYRHRRSAAGERFVQYEWQPVPKWALDVQPHTNETRTSSVTKLTPRFIGGEPHEQVGGEPPEQVTVSATSTFDAAATTLVDGRGSVYGHPYASFARMATMKSVVADCPDPRLRHVLDMIVVKMGRIIETPDHVDSWVDIAGYARTACMVIDGEPED